MKKAIGPQGVTSDGYGHLFVCDVHNACIQLFSVSDGKYFGTYLMRGEEGLGTPRLIRWCRNTSSLVVAHVDSNMVFNISRFHVNGKDLLEREKTVCGRYCSGVKVLNNTDLVSGDSLCKGEYYVTTLVVIPLDGYLFLSVKSVICVNEVISST